MEQEGRSKETDNGKVTRWGPGQSGNLVGVLLAEMQSKASPTEESLFPGNVTGRPLQDIMKFWKAVIAEAGISEYRLHDNRHTHASHLVSSGLSLEIVGRILGHTNPTTTKRYAHSSNSTWDIDSPHGRQCQSIRCRPAKRVLRTPSHACCP
jgi:hypothetical protein